MSEQNRMPQDNRNAAQKIDDLEKAVMSLFQVVNQMGNDLNTVKEATKLLGNKVDAVVKAIQRGQGVNDEVVGQIMTDNNIEDLKNKVESFKEKGFFVAQEQIGENSFVVGRELNADGQVMQPRMQFGFSALSPEVKEKLKGAKANDIIDFGEGKFKFEVQEVYEVVDPAKQAQPVEQEQGAETATATAETSNDSTSEAVQATTDATNTTAEVATQ